jgi:hypothetical protein
MAQSMLKFAILGSGMINAGAHSHSYMPGDETSGLSAMARAFFGGSKLREFVHMFGMEPLPDMIIGTSAGGVTTTNDGMYEQTFISPGVTLENGHIANRWLPIDWPQGHVAIKSFTADVVKTGPNGEMPTPTPCCGGPHEATRDDVFMHHWTVNKWQLPVSIFKEMVKAHGFDYDLTLRKKIGYIEFLAGSGLNSGANGPCWDGTLHLFFGIGNEVRSKTKEGKDAYAFPDPYALEFNSEEMRKKGEFMVLNTHLIDIRGARNRRACEECKCSELGTHGFLSVTTGGLSCCHSTDFDGGKCPIQPSVAKANVTYFIRYTIKWRDFSPATTLPLEVITLDATDNNTKWGDLPWLPGGFTEKHDMLKSDALSLKTVNDGRSGDFDGHPSCHIEYYVPPCAKGESCHHRIVNSWVIPYPMEIVFLRNHFHAGGVNMTTYGPSFSCTGNGTYDKTGNLVDISTCTRGSEIAHTHRVQRGERLFVESHYLQDDLPHYGVMAMSFVYAHVPRDQDVIV